MGCRRSWISFFSLALLFMTANGSLAESPAAPDAPETTFAEREALFESLEASADASFADRAALLEQLWDLMEAEEEARWKQLEREVLQIWDTYHRPEKKMWVDYSADRHAVSLVDFESGKVAVEALVPVDAPPEEAKRVIEQKLETLRAEKDGAGKPIMEGMLPAEMEAKIDSGRIVVAPAQPVSGKDGIEREKVSVSFSMVPDHVQRRAERFLPRVLEEAGKRSVDPALILAVIQTESAFNPKARSHVPAFGLMQIVPRFAGKEAYEAIYGEAKLLTPEYLYNPDNNIELGVTYLGLQHRSYFMAITDLDKRRFVSVCAYNWGPTAMRRRLLPKLDVDALSAAELFERLLAGVPQETRNYLTRVEERRTRYAASLADRS